VELTTFHITAKVIQGNVIQNDLRPMLLPMPHLEGEVTWFSLRLTKEWESCPALCRIVYALRIYNASGRGYGPWGRHLIAAGTKCSFVPNKGTNNTVQNITRRVSARRLLLLRSSNPKRRRVQGI